MKDINLYPLDPFTLQEWLLEQHQVGGVVGNACEDTACPLSRFLSWLYGGSWAVHYADYERLSNDLLYEIDLCLPLPVWAQRFAFLVDWSANDQVVPVLAAAALTHLRQACQENGVPLEEVC